MFLVLSQIVEHFHGVGFRVCVADDAVEKFLLTDVFMVFLVKVLRVVLSLFASLFCSVDGQDIMLNRSRVRILETRQALTFWILGHKVVLVRYTDVQAFHDI